MATLKQRMHRKNTSGAYDIIHLETEWDCITGKPGSFTPSAHTHFYTKTVSCSGYPGMNFDINSTTNIIIPIQARTGNRYHGIFGVFYRGIDHGSLYTVYNQSIAATLCYIVLCRWTSNRLYIEEIDGNDFGFSDNDTITYMYD